MGLGLNCIPFHSGWELAVWEPHLSKVEMHASQIVGICEEVEVEDLIEVFGPQIELDLGQGSSIHDVEPPVEVPDWYLPWLWKRRRTPLWRFLFQGRR